MTKEQVITLMNRLADRLNCWTENLREHTISKKTQRRNLTAILAGPLPPRDVDKALGWLWGNERRCHGQAKKGYNNLCI